MRGPVYIGSNNNNVNIQDMDEFALVNPLVISFGDHGPDLDEIDSLFRKHFGYTNVVTQNTYTIESSRHFNEFFENQKIEYLTPSDDNDIDGLIVIFSGESKFSTNSIVCGHDPQNNLIYRKFYSIYEKFSASNCQYLRGKPKIFILNKYEKPKATFGSFYNYPSYKQVYHPDGDALILKIKFIFDPQKKKVLPTRFIDKFCSIIRNYPSLYLREMTEDIRNGLSMGSQKGCLEMIDTLSAPVRFEKNESNHQE